MSATSVYFDDSSLEFAKNNAESIATRISLIKREIPKNYGKIRESFEYSDSYVDWSQFSEEELKNCMNKGNPLYSMWCSMKARCYNPNSISYDYYGGSGIKMSPEWINNFTRFAEDILEHLGKKPEPYYTIDRIDGRGDYALGNIRWASPLKQSRNRRGQLKVSEKSGLTLAILYKYYRVTGAELKTIYNNYIAEDDLHKIKGPWSSIYKACRSYCRFV